MLNWMTDNSWKLAMCFPRPGGSKRCGWRTRTAPPVRPRQGRCHSPNRFRFLTRKPKDLGHDRTIVFYNDSESFHWHKSEGLCDVRTGVICSPNNFVYDEDDGRTLPDGVVRVTSIANFDLWQETG